MKHSNVFYTMKKDGSFEIAKDAVIVHNKAGFDLFRVTPKYNVFEGRTGCLISFNSSKEEMSIVVEKINTDKTYQEQLRNAIEEQFSKTGATPRYTRPEERREDLFPMPPREKTVLAACIGSRYSVKHRYRENYCSDSFSLYTRVTDGDKSGRDLYLLYDGWMLYMGSEYRRDEIIAALSQGIPDYRQQIESKVEADMADPEKWVNVYYAYYCDRLEEARAHNQPIKEKRDAENAARHAALEQEESERQAKRESEYREAIRKAECAIVAHGEVVDHKNLRGTSLILQLFRENGIELPLRTQGWVKAALHSVNCNQDNWSYRIFKGHKNSATFEEYFPKLREAIVQKFEREVPFAPSEEEEAEGEWDR